MQKGREKGSRQGRSEKAQPLGLGGEALLWMNRTGRQMEGEAETHCPPPPQETRLLEPEKQKAMGGAALQVCPL